MEMRQVQTKVRCPRCGSYMIRRIAKHGFNKGHYFLGCSNFPQCGVILAKVCNRCGSDMALIYDPERPKFRRYCWACTNTNRCNSRKSMWDNKDYVIKRENYTPTNIDKNATQNKFIHKPSEDSVEIDYEDHYSEDEMIGDLLEMLGDFDDWDTDFQETYGDAYRNYRQKWDDD